MIGLEVNFCKSLFLWFFYFEFFLLRLGFSFFWCSLFVFSFRLLLSRLLLFFYWDFRLFGPLLNQGAFIKQDNTIFIIFQFELNTKNFLFRMLGFCNKIADLFLEANNCWLILYENLNCLFSSELNCLAWRNFASCLKDHLPLLFWIQFGIRTQKFIVVNKIPVKFNSICCLFVKTVFLDSKERALDGSHQSTSSSYWFTRIQCSRGFMTKDLLSYSNKLWDSSSSTY